MRRTNLLHFHGNKLVECVDDFFLLKKIILRKLNLIF